MSAPRPFLHWPVETRMQFLVMLAAAVVLLVLAVFIELRRRRRDARDRAAAEWRAARNIASERELTEEEWKRLEALVKTHAPDAPVQAITQRARFDACIEADIAALGPDAPVNALAERGLLLRDLRVKLGLDFVPYGQRIHSTRELYPGQVLWVSADGSDAGAWRRMAVTHIDEAFLAAAEDAKAEAPPLAPGQTVYVRLWREDDARYSFTTRIARRDDTPRRWLLHHTRDLERLQSRAHFRVRYEEPCDLGIVDLPVDGGLDGVEKRPVVTTLRGHFTSLSAGGFAAIVQQPVPRQILVRVSLKLEADAEPFEATARLIAATPRPGGQYLLRAAFAVIGEDHRETIARHVVRMQQTLPAPGSVVVPE